MNRNSITVAILATGTWLSVATPPTRAQIAAYVDERGKLVYMNDDSTTDRRGNATGSQTAKASASPAGSAVTPPDHLDRLVHEAAARHKVDPALVKAVINTESGWNPHAVSRKGAVGLMQLIPETAQRYGVGNAFDPAQNVEGGTTYLKSLLDRYNGNVERSLAAYNAGEHAVDLSGGIPAIRETQRYVQKVTDEYFRPGLDHDPELWSPPKSPVRQEVNSKGRVVYTNE